MSQYIWPYDTSRGKIAINAFAHVVIATAPTETPSGHEAMEHLAACGYIDPGYGVPGGVIVDQSGNLDAIKEKKIPICPKCSHIMAEQGFISNGEDYKPCGVVSNRGLFPSDVSRHLQIKQLH